MLCPIPFLAKYKDILGVPNEGFHKNRIGPYALNDILGTILIAIILAFFYKPYSNFFYNFLFYFIILFIVGEFLHYIFCVRTAFIKQILNL